jgi:hypothetical protein
MRRLFMLLVALAAVLAGAGHARSGETVAVLGTGRVAAALGPQFARLGFQVVYGSRDPPRPAVAGLVAATGAGASAAGLSEAVARARYVVVALPWGATEQALAGLDLAGRIVIDPTNALRVGPEGLMEMAVETSAGERIQALAPGARVVKAFNAVGAHVMADPTAAGGAVTIPLVGNDPAAKAEVARLVERMGFETLDLGPIRHARALEAMTLLYMVPYMSGRRDEAFEYHLRRGTAPRQTQGLRPAQ